VRGQERDPEETFDPEETCLAVDHIPTGMQRVKFDLLSTKNEEEYINYGGKINKTHLLNNEDLNDLKNWVHEHLEGKDWYLRIAKHAHTKFHMRQLVKVIAGKLCSPITSRGQNEINRYTWKCRILSDPRQELQGKGFLAGREIWSQYVSTSYIYIRDRDQEELDEEIQPGGHNLNEQLMAGGLLIGVINKYNQRRQLNRV
jgi:hypothetical protein